MAVILNEPEKASIISATKGSTLIAPGCLPWEIGNAFSAMLKRKLLSSDDVSSGLAVYGIIPIQESAILLKSALHLCSRHDIYAYDAYYLDLAQRGSSPLLTLDRRMAQVATLEGIKLKKLS